MIYTCGSESFRGARRLGRILTSAVNSLHAKERNEGSLKFLVLVWSRDYKSGIVFSHPELSHWPLWFALPNIVRTYTERPPELASERRAFWAIPGRAQSCPVVLQWPGRTPVSTKLQIACPPWRWTFCLGVCCSEGGSYLAAPPSPSRGEGGDLVVLSSRKGFAKAGLKTSSSFAWEEGWGWRDIWWSHWSCSRAILEHSGKTIKWLWRPHRQLILVDYWSV